MMNIDQRIIMPDGNIRWQRWSDRAIFDPSGTITEYQSVGRDITNTKEAEKTLRESEEKYRLIAENTADTIWIFDMDLHMTYVSPSVKKMRGFTVEESMKQTLDHMMTPEAVAAVIKLFNEEMAREAAGTADPDRSVSIETEDYCRDGSVIRVENTIRFLREADGRPFAILGISHDITDRKRAEEALRQASRKLNLLSSITRHDINNQLTVLMGFIALLERKQPDPSFTDYFQKIRTSAHRISAMIQFTKEYEQIGVKAPIWQDCRTLVETAAKRTRLGNIMIKNDLPAGAELFTDPLIARVFYNLMDNAVRYGGKITTIRFSMQESDDHHLILCEDDGVGIPADQKEKIFERGFGKNTGLGLALSREILDITGIMIRETGESGKGAQFEMTIPKGMFR